MKEKGLTSVIVNTVHDSVLLDCRVDEVDSVMHILENEMSPGNIRQMIEGFYGFDMDIPLTIDTKRGSDWLNMS
jgi:DNA polymerase I-like protein with 3'-5' exonuclease and polymerase domains